jgi:hypothetical protein
LEAANATLHQQTQSNIRSGLILSSTQVTQEPRSEEVKNLLAAFSEYAASLERLRAPSIVSELDTSLARSVQAIIAELQRESTSPDHLDASLVSTSVAAASTDVAVCQQLQGVAVQNSINVDLNCGR